MELFAESIGIVIQCIIYIVMIDSLANINSDHKSRRVKLICIGFNFVVWFCAKDRNSLWNIWCVVLDILGYYLYLLILSKKRYLMMFSMIMATQIIYQVGALMVAVAISVIDVIIGDSSYYIFFVLLSYLLTVSLLYPFYLLNQKYKIGKILEKVRIQYIVIIVGICFQLSRLVIRIYNNNSQNIFLYIALTSMIMGGAFGILWIADWHYAEREKRLLIEDNQRMSQRLHRSKEIFPALNRTLEKLKTEEGSSEISGILEEIHQLCKEQIEESEHRDMQDKIFPTTEIHILDEQISIYGTETAEKGINFDVFVGTSLAEVLKEHQIKEMEILRLIGDLMRNAIRAVEKTEDGKGNILLVMGCVGEIFQIELYDDGVPFPVFILNEFGKRGNTDGGTGNGIADILELLEKYQATLKIVEYEDRTTFSKGISIIWDGKKERWLDTYRGAEISGEGVLFPK